MPLRLAIVGLGKIARDQHVPSVAHTLGIELAAVASRNAALPGLPCFPTLGALLRDGPPIDAVALCTPPQVRRAEAETALRAGKHVLLEKPPGATVSSLVPLGALAHDRGRTPGGADPVSDAAPSGVNQAGCSPELVPHTRGWYPDGSLACPGVPALRPAARVRPLRLRW